MIPRHYEDYEVVRSNPLPVRLHVSVGNIFKYFKGLGRKTGYDIISNYIQYIEDAFLIHRSERYNIRGKDIIGGNVKFYMNDLAFKNYLYHGFGLGFGYLLENLVYLDFLRAGYKVYVGTITDKEVDFVARKSDRLIYVQCAYQISVEETILREYSSLEAIPDHYEKYVVTLDDLTLPSKNGIRHMQAWKFSKQVLGIKFTQNIPMILSVPGTPLAIRHPFTDSRISTLRPEARCAVCFQCEFESLGEGWERVYLQTR